MRRNPSQRKVKILCPPNMIHGFRNSASQRRVFRAPVGKKSGVVTKGLVKVKRATKVLVRLASDTKALAKAASDTKALAKAAVDTKAPAKAAADTKVLGKAVVDTKVLARAAADTKVLGKTNTTTLRLPPTKVGNKPCNRIADRFAAKFQGRPIICSARHTVTCLMFRQKPSSPIP